MTTAEAPPDFVPFFERLKEVREEVIADEEEHEYELEVIEASRPTRPADINASIAQTIASLALCGFWSASQVTRTYMEGKVIKSGERAGESRPDKELTNVFIHAVAEDRRALSIWYEEGKLRSATLYSPPAGAVKVVKTIAAMQKFIEGGSSGTDTQADL